MKATSKPLGLLITAILAFSLLFLVIGNPLTKLWRAGKTATTITTLEFPCDETGIKQNEYEFAIKRALQTCQSSEAIQLIKEAKYCFPDEELDIPDLKKQKYYLQAGNGIVLCAYKPLLKQLPKCENHTGMKKAKCLLAELESRGYLLKKETEEDNCNNDYQTIGMYDNKKYCLKKTLATDFTGAEDKPVLTINIVGTCPANFEPTGAYYIEKPTQTNTNLKSFEQSLEEPPPQNNLEIISGKIQYLSETNNAAEIFFEAINNGQTISVPTIDRYTDSQDITIKGLRLDAPMPWRKGEKGKIILLTEYQKSITPFTLYLSQLDQNSEEQTSFLPITKISIPATPRIIIKPVSFTLYRKDNYLRYKVILTLFNKFNKKLTEPISITKNTEDYVFDGIKINDNEIATTGITHFLASLNEGEQKLIEITLRTTLPEDKYPTINRYYQQNPPYSLEYPHYYNRKAPDITLDVAEISFNLNQELPLMMQSITVDNSRLIKMQVDSNIAKWGGGDYVANVVSSPLDEQTAATISDTGEITLRKINPASGAKNILLSKKQIRIFIKTTTLNYKNRGYEEITVTQPPQPSCPKEKQKTQGITIQEK